MWEKYYNDGKLPSHIKKGSFWWRDVLKLLENFKGMASVFVQSGSSCLFWDLWFGLTPKQAFPELYSFTKKPSLTLASAKANPSFIAIFNLPLSVEAYEQFLGLEDILLSFNPTADDDVWSYIWGRV